MTPAQFAALAAVGLAVGALGTLVGAGGGFLLMPLLLFVYPHDSPAVLSGISLAVVFANATSGTLAYARLKRIDVRAGLLFAACGWPGAIVGALVSERLDRRTFDPILGTVLMLGGVLVLFRPKVADHAVARPTRRLVERDGTVHEYAPRLAAGAAFSLVVGFLSSLLGIGGGILHVPAMALLLGFPTHVATATSHFVLALLALVGLLVHARSGTLAAGMTRIVPLALGALVGAQLGAAWSTRVHGVWILRTLGIALITVGVRFVLPH